MFEDLGEHCSFKENWDPDKSSGELIRKMGRQREVVYEKKQAAPFPVASKGKED